MRSTALQEQEAFFELFNTVGVDWKVEVKEGGIMKSKMEPSGFTNKEQNDHEVGLFELDGTASKRVEARAIGAVIVDRRQ